MTQPRPSTADEYHADGSITVTMQRCCNGCGRKLGDVTMDEVDDAIAGRALPNTRIECGCIAYGSPPSVLASWPLPQWQEFMHYLYLPVRFPAKEWQPGTRLPERLGFLRPIIHLTMADAAATAPHLADPYVTARRGYATPGNPLNRPGWHTDDFGGADLNYTWADQLPTRFLTTPTPPPISHDDARSMRQFEALAVQAEKLHPGYAGLPRIVTYPDCTLLRLDPYVIHDTPLIPPPGGMRSFFKISISTKRYDLVGNSHNHLFDYAWPMTDRAALRNRPHGNRDYSEDPACRPTARPA